MHQLYIVFICEAKREWKKAEVAAKSRYWRLFATRSCAKREWNNRQDLDYCNDFL